MRLLVGLGNPGREYTGTRHNVGFEVASYLAQRHGIAINRRGFRGLYGLGSIEGENVCILLPMTYMNLSGDSVAEASRFYRLAPEDIVVVLDDVNLPVGQVRLRKQGSAGGQKGLAHIIQRLGSEAIPRVRVGIGKPQNGDLVSYVLSRFRKEEEPLIVEAIETAADAIECALREGWDVAMSRYNARKEARPSKKEEEDSKNGGYPLDKARGDIV